MARYVRLALLGASGFVAMVWVLRQGPWSLSQTIVAALLGLGTLAAMVLESRGLLARWLGTPRGRGLVFGLGLLAALAALVPPERFRGLNAARQQRLLPFWIWLTWCSGVCLWREPWRRQIRERGRAVWRAWQWCPRGQWLGYLVVLGLLWGSALVIGYTDWGVRAPWALNWQGFPTPVLPQHLLLAFGLAWLLGFLSSRRRQIGPGWYGVFALVATWLIWMALEPAPNYFLPRAYPPHDVRYPASDARVYVLSGQQARKGYGYYASAAETYTTHGHPFVSKTGLQALFAFFPWPLTRGTWPWLMGAWLLLNALLVPAAYWVGRMLHSQRLGFALAALLVLREVAAFTAAARLDTVHVKNFMSEPLLRLLFLAWVAGLIGWLRLPRDGRQVPAGALVGALGAWTVLVRVESLVALAGLAFILLILMLLRRVAFRAFVVAGLALLAVWLPWMMRTWFLTSWYAPTERTPWFFGFKVRAGASAEYRAPPTPTPTPSPPETFAPRYVPIVYAPGAPHAQPSGRPAPVTLGPGAQNSQEDDGAFVPWWQRVLAYLRSLPLVDTLSQWPRDVWLHLWHYIGRNVVTTWTMFPWTPRFYDAYQVTKLRPLAEGRPMTWWHGLALGLNLAVVALGWVTVWRRDRWAAMAPWLLYGFYILGISFARTGGGRYVVPIDWIPVMFYLVGWLTVLRGLAFVLGFPMPRAVARVPRARVHPGWALLLASGLALVSALGTWVEVHAVWQSRQQPELTPPRHRLVTVDELFAQLEAWQVRGALAESALREAERARPLRLEWGFAYFPRYVAAGQYCGDWCGYLTPERPLLFLVVIGTWGQTQLVIPVDDAPEAWPLGSEVIAFICPPKEGLHHREALLVAIRTPQGHVLVYQNERLSCDYAFVPAQQP